MFSPSRTQDTEQLRGYRKVVGTATFSATRVRVVSTDDVWRPLAYRYVHVRLGLTPAFPLSLSSSARADITRCSRQASAAGASRSGGSGTPRSLSVGFASARGSQSGGRPRPQPRGNGDCNGNGNGINVVGTTTRPPTGARRLLARAIRRAGRRRPSPRVNDPAPTRRKYACTRAFRPKRPAAPSPRRTWRQWLA